MMSRKPLGDLLAETPQMIVNLAKAEIQHLKGELAAKAKGVGVGGGLLAAAGFFAIFLFSWLIYAGYQGLNVVFEPWLSALIVSAVLLVIVLILALVGMSLIKKNKDFDDLEALDSMKDDVNMVRGLGHAADGTDPLDDLPTSTATPTARTTAADDYRTTATTRVDGDLR